jgi:hypothetical protein
MHRRTVLGTLAVGFGIALGGCSRSSVDGTVVSNETPLVFSHEYATQSTPSGVRIVVEVTVENNGDEQITPEDRAPQITCTFVDSAGETLHQSGLKLVDSIGVGEETTLEFTLAVDTDEVEQYKLRSDWIES